jgi:O-methyltransferase
MHYRYHYGFTPEELLFFVQCLNDTRGVPGDVMEIGIGSGETACFLGQHLKYARIEKAHYCIDTFSGFTREDVAFEVGQRNHRPDEFRGFRVNSVNWFRYQLALNRLPDTVCVQADVKDYRFERPVSFCLLDVDLYQPTLYALRNVWPVLSPGGIILLDDCSPPPQHWDGSLQAYEEFVARQGLPRKLLPLRGLYADDKIAFIQKPH